MNRHEESPSAWKGLAKSTTGEKSSYGSELNRALELLDSLGDKRLIGIPLSRGEAVLAARYWNKAMKRGLLSGRRGAA